MIKEIVKVKLTEEYKENALSLIEDTIDRVLMVHKVVLDNKERRAIKNLSLDQLNINVTNRINSKTLWVFNIEDCLPVIVEREKSLPKMGSLLQDKKEKGSYKMKPNLTWTLNRKNNNDEGLNREEFEETVLNMLLEDLETAAFYGALSHVGDEGGQ